MTWTLSCYRAGDTVEVKSKEEILSTLDAQGCLDGMPFMPEMLQYCGQRFPVRAIAHKTCETAYKTWQGRRLSTTVHLGNLRCDGSAHGGCDAACTLFWKDAWLRPAKSAAPAESGSGSHTRRSACDEAQLLSATRRPTEPGSTEPVFECQATRLYDATTPLAWWDPRQYFYDVVTGNHSIARVLRVAFLAVLRNLDEAAGRVRYVRGVFWRVNSVMHRWLTGRREPSIFRKVQPSEKTPTGQLGLQPGEWVRIKPQEEIERTLDKNGKNRGLSFDPGEMAPYCGGTYRVRSVVKKVVDEANGRMLQIKQPCIILDDVVCKAEYASCRLNCPRAFYSFWRELWLERVDSVPPSRPADPTAS